MIQTELTVHVIASWFRGLQDRICAGLELTDGNGRFVEDSWERPGGGGGRSRILTEGDVIEKGGVNFSHVFGAMPEVIARKLELPAGVDFHATGVSLVIHPHSPMVPIVHMNVRYFEISNGLSWFGGGIDLTPIYISVPDARYFHETVKAACDRHDPSYYAPFKKWCDDYFFLKHRKETRGIGGIFFDHLKGETAAEKDAYFRFVQDIGETFVPLYSELIRRNRDIPFGDRQKDFQLLRRSRYVEFNLVYDKGTKFGLDTDGRTESILMSMPPLARWEYGYEPEPGSEEERTMALLKPVDWLAAD
jgi:coproporphyrinogen III oxidase